MSEVETFFDCLQIMPSEMPGLTAEFHAAAPEARAPAWAMDEAGF
jgi:hypothetical protein